MLVRSLPSSPYVRPTHDSYRITTDLSPVIAISLQRLHAVSDVFPKIDEEYRRVFYKEGGFWEYAAASAYHDALYQYGAVSRTPAALEVWLS